MTPGSGSPRQRGSAARHPSGSVRSVNYATSPLLASRTPPGRSRFVVFLLAAAFAVLLGRAAWVQVIDNEGIQKEGAKRILQRQDLAASRGRILDRQGQPLATSVPLQAVHVYGRTFTQDPAKRRALAQALDMSPQTLEDKLQGVTGTVVLRRHVDVASWQRVQALRLAGVSAVPDFKRHYPEGEATAHLVGFTDAFDKQGVEGLERQFQRQLEGRPGDRTVVRDRAGRVVGIAGTPQPPEDGNDVQLSIDARMQFYAYQRLRDTVREHGALGGSVVALDVLTGELLVVANYPSFDPSNRPKKKNFPLRNVALVDTFEPGSTMKAFTVAQALEEGRKRPDSLIDTGQGSIVVGRATIRDTHRHGVMTVTDVLAKSSNVGAIKLGLEPAPAQTWKMYNALGLGTRPELEFPRVAGGLLRPAEKWKRIEQSSMSYGYALSASVLQMARAYSVFARDGELVPVTLLARKPPLADTADAAAAADAADAAASPPPQPVVGHRVYSEKTARQVREMLRAAVLQGGTGELAQAHAQGYSVAGKTGTARKREEGHGYSRGKYQSWFVGLAPASQPRIVVAVMVDAPSRGQFYGGQVAGPVFGQVVQQSLRLLGVPHDIEVQTQLVVDASGAQQESF